MNIIKQKIIKITFTNLAVLNDLCVKFLNNKIMKLKNIPLKLATLGFSINAGTQFLSGILNNNNIHNSFNNIKWEQALLSGGLNSLFFMSKYPRYSFISTAMLEIPTQSFLWTTYYGDGK